MPRAPPRALYVNVESILPSLAQSHAPDGGAGSSSPSAPGPTPALPAAGTVAAATGPSCAVASAPAAFVPAPDAAARTGGPATASGAGPAAAPTFAAAEPRAPRAIPAEGDRDADTLGRTSTQGPAKPGTDAVAPAELAPGAGAGPGGSAAGRRP